MALNIAWEGTGVILNCDAVNDSAAIGGSWTEFGGGTITVPYDETYIYGDSSVGSKYASKTGWTYNNLTTPLNFASGGNQEGELIYIWVGLSGTGAIDTLANEGLGIRLGTSTTAYSTWVIGGSGVGETNGWTGGWRLFVLDPVNTTPTSTVGGGIGTGSSVGLIGLWIATITSVRAESIFIDQVSVASGLRVTGSSTTGWQDIVDYCNDYTNRAWGIWQENEGIFFSYGKTYIGNGVVDTTFSDRARTIQFGTSQFYNTGGSWVSTFPATGSGIVLEDNATYKTEFTDGVLVGTDNGRAGSTIVGNADQDVYFDASNLTNNANSFVKLYNTTFNKMNGGIKLLNDTGSLYYGGAITNSGQFDPVGAPVLRNLTLAGTTDPYVTAGIDGAALLWNGNINIQKCSFIANTTADGAHGIQHDTAGSYTYTDLNFSGNDYDILFTDTGSLLIANTGTSNTGSNTSISAYEAPSGTVTISSAAAITFTGLEDGTEIRLMNTGTQTELAADNTTEQESTTTGSVTFSYNGATQGNVDIAIAHLDYKNIWISNYNLPATDSEYPISQVLDRNYSNPGGIDVLL